MKQQVNRVQLGSLFSFLSIRFHFMHVLLPRVIWLAYAEPRFHFRDVESSPSGVFDTRLVTIHSEQIRRDAGVRWPSTQKAH